MLYQEYWYYIKQYYSGFMNRQLVLGKWKMEIEKGKQKMSKLEGALELAQK